MKRKVIGVGLLFLISATTRGQQLDPASRWATIAATEYGFFPNIVYREASGQDLKLDVITRGPALQKGPGQPQKHKPRADRPSFTFMEAAGSISAKMPMAGGRYLSSRGE